jgi:hypothetical protein
MLGMTAFTGYYRPFNGYLDEFRYTVGKARYGAANFVVQNAPFPNGVAAYTDTYNMQFADSVAMSEASVIVAPSTLILATSYLPGPSGVQAVTFPGCSAGQLAVLIASRSNVGAPPSGWNTVSNFSMVTTGYPQQVFTKILTAADIASGVTWNYSAGNGLFALLVYAGPTVCTQVSRAQGGSGALVVPGITKNAASRQLIAYSVCSQNNQNQLPSAPWTVRVPQVISPTVNTVVADLPSGSYGNGSAVTWLPNSNTMLGEILELT